ncbi:MAG TPA: hypothetical protein VJ997_05130 [Longimicrobiales bacterium]|nr:hypothetical protein [Longimicrobiales bacterium]
MKQVPLVPLAPLAFALILTAVACSPGETPDESAPSAEAPTGVVDSVFPMDVMVARFRAEIPEPGRLSGGAHSRDALVEGVVRALEEADTLAFERMAVTLPEWAWLYYPTSAQARPPYELPPGMAWLQVQQGNRTGVLRALERFGGQALDYRGYACGAEPTLEGENRVWVGCLVTLGRDGEEPTPVRLFSAILERDGRFAVLSYANDF